MRRCLPLDVSVQGLVINLLEELQDQLNLTYIFVAHDLSVVRHICDRIAVMYVGRIVELAETEQIFESAESPFRLHVSSEVSLRPGALLGRSAGATGLFGWA